MYEHEGEIDYPEEQIDEYEREAEMVAVAESNAPPAMLAAQRAFDRVAEREAGH